MTQGAEVQFVKIDVEKFRSRSIKLPSTHTNVGKSPPTGTSRIHPILQGPEENLRVFSVRPNFLVVSNFFMKI